MGYTKVKLGVSSSIAPTNNGSLDRRHRVDRESSRRFGICFRTDIGTLLLILNNKSVRRGSVKNAPTFLVSTLELGDFEKIRIDCNFL